ncbi:Serine/threonine-protein kinase [Pelomyxa schiedti]|nr:Serine/threonine-protein kinase [Pelomyxa schiedti]
MKVVLTSPIQWVKGIYLQQPGKGSDQPTYGASHEMHVVAILGSLSYSDPIYTTMTVEGLDSAGIAPSIDDPGYFTISMSCQEAFVAGGSVSIAYSESRYTDSTTAGPPAVVTFAPRWRCYVPGCPDYCYEHGTCIEETGDCVCNDDGAVTFPAVLTIVTNMEPVSRRLVTVYVMTEEIPFDYFIPFTIKDVPGAGNKLWYGLTAGGFYVDRRYFMTWSNLIPYEAFPQWNTDYSGKNDSSVYLDPGVYGIQYASDTQFVEQDITIPATMRTNAVGVMKAQGFARVIMEVSDSEGEIWSDTPPSGLYDDMHFVTDTSCSWLISPINKFEELVIDFPFVGLDKGGRVTLYTSNYSGYPIDLISSINTEAPAPLVLRDKNIYVYFSGSTSSHGFVLHYSTRMIPISNVAIGFIVVAIIFGAVCGSVGAGAAIFFVVRRRKRSLHALRTMPGEKTPLLSKEELAGTAARFAGKELATAGFVMKKTKLDFDIAESDACPVMQQLRDIIKIKNRSNHTAAYSVFLPDAPHLVKITATPGRGLIPSGGVVVVDLALTLQYTTHYDQPIRVEVYAASSLKAARAIWDTPPADREIVGGAFVNVKLEGAVSERIDPEEVMLDPTPLASGGFGSVFRGVYRSQIVAVKILKHQEAFREAEMKDFEEECELMKQLRHPCIVSFVGASHVPGKLCICTELIEKGSLSSLLESDKDLPLALLLKFALNTADAMVFLHQNKILFRDLKCGNLLLVSTALDAPVNCKLTDFGTARNVENPEQMKNYTCGLGTPVYMAPELISTDQYNSKVDVFSFGMCLWEMWTREEPWSGIAVWDIPKKVTVGDRPEIPKDCPEHLTKLIVRCWDQNQNNRPAFTEIFDILTEMTKEEIASFQAAGGTIEAPGSESDSKEEMPVMTDAAGAVEMDSRKKHPKSKRHAHVSRGKRTSVKANPDGEGALLSMGGDDAPVQHSDASGFHHVDLTKKKTTGTKMVLVTPEPSSSAH